MNRTRALSNGTTLTVLCSMFNVQCLMLDVPCTMANIKLTNSGATPSTLIPSHNAKPWQMFLMSLSFSHNPRIKKEFSTLVTKWKRCAYLRETKHARSQLNETAKIPKRARKSTKMLSLRPLDTIKKLTFYLNEITWKKICRQKKYLSRQNNSSEEK